MNLTKITNVQFEGIDHADYPEYCDAFIASAVYDGIPMTEDQLQEINNNQEFLHKELHNFLN